MKPLFTFFMISSALIFSSFTTQNTMDEVIGALRSGNSAELSKYFDESVDVTLPDESSNYSKAQATLILKDFFTTTGVKGFELKHKGDYPGGHFCVGTLQTKAGNFRTNVFLKIINGKEVVKEIRFQSIE